MTARIPFALVGVLLLVGSATFAGSLGTPSVGEPNVDRAMDRTESATQSAVRGAVTDAATAAARNPVTVPASNAVGSELGQSKTFRNALRVRVYVTVRDRLDHIERTRGDVTVTASLPGTDSGGALADELDRVSVSRAGSQGTALGATVRNVTLTATRNGEVVGQRTVSPTVTVPVPTLAVHDRVNRFERRLNAGPGKPGLGSRLTAKLYGLTWARGFAQYGGAPIENVVANRHLALLTNGIALSMQREQFGRSDPRGRSLLGWASAHTAITDTLTGTDTQMTNQLAKAQSYAGLQTLPADILAEDGTTDSPVRPDDEATIAVNRTADIAFWKFLQDVNSTISEAYETRIQLRQRVVASTERVRKEPREPGPDWELLDTSRSTSVQVSTRREAAPTLDGAWHRFEYYPRRVSTETKITRVWNTTSGVRRTVEVRADIGDVDVLLVGRHDGGRAPHRPVETVHEDGGPLGGPNLQGVESAARRQLLGGRSIDALAVEGLDSGGRTTTKTVTGRQPDGLYEYVYADLRRTRERVRDLSVTATQGDLATFQVNPGRRLAEKLRSEWDSLAAVPGSYQSVADRARYNARIAYLRAVLARLQERASKHETSREKIDDKLEEKDLPQLGKVETDYEDRGQAATQSALDIGMRVETAPSYLTLGKLDGQSIPTLPPGTATHPLVAKNVNYFTVPYGDVAQGIVETFLGPKRVRLTTAVQTLKSAQATEPESGSRLARNRAKLEAKVERSTRYLGGRASSVVAGYTPATWNESPAVVESALERWRDQPAALGEAWTNGSAVEMIHDEARSRYDLSEPRADQLAFALRIVTAVSLTNKRAQPPLPAVNGTAKRLKSVAKGELAGKVGDKLSTAAKKGLETATGRTLSRLPAGLPLAPPFLPWVTTVNYWSAQVRGEYTRFVVSVPRGTPDTAGARFRYVRARETVTLDIDGDGSGERLGRTTPVSFRTQTSVAIAVPPGMRGVGDVDGVMTETSAGWPHAG